MIRYPRLLLLVAATVGVAGAQEKSGAGATDGACRLAGQPVPGFAVKKLPEEQFRKLHAAVAPRGERWTEIPWETDLQAARQRARRERKPLLMWVMDGHPLGCT